MPRPVGRAANSWGVARTSALRALDAVYTARTRPYKSGVDLLREVTDPRTPRYDRLGAAVQWMDARLPRLVRRLAGAIQRAERLPFRVEQVEPFAFGRGSTCVIMHGRPPRVLKVFRGSLGQDAARVVGMARQLKADYETLRRWYADVPDLVVHTTHVVLHSPLRGTTAAARIQPLLPASARDLLGPSSHAELVDVVRRESRLRVDFCAFVRATRVAWERENRVLDLVGEKNVVVLDGASGPALRVVDLGIMDLDAKRREAPRVYDRAAATLERLERVAAAIQ